MSGRWAIRVSICSRKGAHLGVRRRVVHGAISPCSRRSCFTCRTQDSLQPNRNATACVPSPPHHTPPIHRDASPSSNIWAGPRKTSCWPIWRSSDRTPRNPNRARPPASSRLRVRCCAEPTQPPECRTLLTNNSPSTSHAELSCVPVRHTQQSCRTGLGRDALGSRRRLPPPRPLPQRTHLPGLVLEPSPN